MTVHLLNSAMMPAADGMYRSYKMTQEAFIDHAREANAQGNLVSYIGYKSTAEMLSKLLGFTVRENREETIIDDGDTLLVARIKYRLGQHPKPDAQPSLDDLEFRIVYYSATLNII